MTGSTKYIFVTGGVTSSLGKGIISASLAKQDYRLLVRAGRGEVAPGIAADQQAAAKARCGVRYLDGFGDVIKPDQKEAHARLSAYAADYNRRMLAHCPPVDGKP